MADTTTASFLIYLTRLAIANFVGWRGFLAATYKLGNKSYHDVERRRREIINRRGPSRVIHWLSTPSQLDAIPALLWAIALTPIIVANIPH